MSTETRLLSSSFQKLYCDPGVYDPFSVLHPISFKRVLPFQARDLVVDDPGLVHVEQAHLADRNDVTRRNVVDAFFKWGLLEQEDADNLKSVIDYFEVEFFELMGLVYANAGMLLCALRWYREFIVELEANPQSGLDNQGIYASVGYCLYSLGLFAEAISWSKSCIGSRPTADAVCQALIGYEAQLAGGVLQATERAGWRTRYTVSVLEPAHASQTTSRLTAAMKAFDPLQEFYIDWVNHDAPAPTIQPEGYPFQVERDMSSVPRHKMNLLFAICGQADAMVEKGFVAEAKALLYEAAMLEPQAGFVRDRLQDLP